MKRTELEVGDVILISNAFTKYKVKIHRVTKTIAIGKPINDSDRFELRFKRKVVWGNTAKLVNEDRWNTTDRTIVTLDKSKEEL